MTETIESGGMAAAARANGPGIVEPTAAEDTGDMLKTLSRSSEVTAAMRLLAERLLQVETRMPDSFKVGQSFLALTGRVDRLEQVVQHLASQQAIAELQMERQVRGMALDLAIKALPDVVRGSEDANDRIVDLASAFLSWLKSTPA